MYESVLLILPRPGAFPDQSLDDLPVLALFLHHIWSQFLLMYLVFMSTVSDKIWRIPFPMRNNLISQDQSNRPRQHLVHQTSIDSAEHIGWVWALGLAVNRLRTLEASRAAALSATARLAAAAAAIALSLCIHVKYWLYFWQQGLFGHAHPRFVRRWCWTSFCAPYLQRDVGHIHNVLPRQAGMLAVAH